MIEKKLYQEQDNVMKSECPVCGGHDSLEITNRTDNIPYFGDILETSVVCKKCGYTNSDNICLERKDPIKYILEINDTKLNTRIAKSQSATVTIPELGLKVEPGPKSQGYVSNVEGILSRFEDAILRALTLYSDDDKDTEDNATYLMQRINNIKMGELTTTLVVEDPLDTVL